MKVRIRPSGYWAGKMQWALDRTSNTTTSPLDASRVSPFRVRALKLWANWLGTRLALALAASAICVLAALASFTMLCWKTGSDLKLLPAFGFSEGRLSERGTWLMLALAASVFAKLIEGLALTLQFGNNTKNRFTSADELPAERLSRLLVARE